ncbi:MAG: L-lactate dehydrogenase [Chloroflexota bacterium]
MRYRGPKISVVGVGKVGTTVAFSVMMKGLAKELLLVDRNKDVATGEAYDLMHASPFSRPVDIKAGELYDTRNSDIIVISASVPVKQAKSRLELAQANLALYKEIIPVLAEQSPEAIFLVITNPVDVMTYFALKLSGFPPTRVIGTGTLIDSGRFRSLLAESSGANPNDINAYIIGEHGDSQFPVLSSANVGGRPFKIIERVYDFFEKARGEGHMVFEHKGHSNYAIGLAVLTIIESLVLDSRRVLPVSILIERYLGVSDVCLSIPAVVGRNGVQRVIELDLNETEQNQFRKSAEMLKAFIKSVEG